MLCISSYNNCFKQLDSVSFIYQRFEFNLWVMRTYFEKIIIIKLIERITGIHNLVNTLLFRELM